jgi:hypothetical protein
MYLFFHRLRILLTIAFVVALGGGIFYFISLQTFEDNVKKFNLQVTVAVATEIQNALMNVTRTVEAPMNRFQVVILGENESLEALALRYGTTLRAIQIANGIDLSVTEGSGNRLIVPVNIAELNPPRIVEIYVAQIGDTLPAIADRRRMSLQQLEQDNPVLVQRGLIPGDLVFVSIELLT